MNVYLKRGDKVVITCPHTYSRLGSDIDREPTMRELFGTQGVEVLHVVRNDQVPAGTVVAVFRDGDRV